MLELVNRDRASHKLPALHLRSDLSAIARAHSRDMLDHGFFAHKSPRTGGSEDRLAKAGIRVRAAGENIAAAPDVATAQKWLMLSPKHRENILHKEFSHVGFGILRRKGGELVVTQLFIKPVPVLDPAGSAQQILEGINRARVARGLPKLVDDARLVKHALAHSQRAARRGKADHVWLHDRVAADVPPWRTPQSAVFLTEKLADVAASPIAQRRGHTRCGIGCVPGGKPGAGLWVTLICASR